MVTRRRLLISGTAATLLPFGPGFARHAAAASHGTLPAESIEKYVAPLVLPPAMPKTAESAQLDYYEIAVRQFRQQVLPSGMPSTTVWSYGSVNHADSFNYPAFTIEARCRRPVRVKWINGLVDGNGAYLPHLLPVDPTLFWANPGGGAAGRDSRPTFADTPGPYTGPVPIVTHLHGAHAAQESDGFPQAWYLPAANDLPAGFSREGTRYSQHAAEFSDRYGVGWSPGSATFQYPNDQRAATLWYHDHALGITRLNVYAGPAGFYLLRGGPDLPPGMLPGPAPGVGADPFGRFYEIPIVIQDRSFNADGSLFYPGTRAFFDGFEGPYLPHSDAPPIWNPEFFGDTIVVNGRTWPVLEVEPRRYRFRFLNGCNSRFLVLKQVGDPLAPRPAPPALAFWQIGGDGGLLRQPVLLEQLLLAPAERADVIVDFTGLPVGSALYLINEAPDEPFGGGEPPGDFDVANPATTGQVMKFTVRPLVGIDTSRHPAQLSLPAFGALGHVSRTRRLSLNERASSFFDGPVEALLGTVDTSGNPVPRAFSEPITENPSLGTTEVWEIHNFSEDAHPIHIHQVQFEVLGRVSFGGAARGPERWEAGPKDTVIAYPGEITRVKARFDLPGLFVWHCHILEHEDNEMMRPYFVGSRERR